MASISELVFVDSAGFQFPDYPTVLAALQDDYRTIYGADVYLEADSQDGQWLAIVALAIHDTLSAAAAVYNSFSPLTAVGDALSRQVKLNGIRRRIPSFSTVDLLIVGQVGTNIINGQAEDNLGQRWALPASVTIPLSGETTVTATAVEAGSVGAAPNTINKISTPTLGWQTVNNPAAATEGAPVETDAELRLRQALSVAVPSLTIFEGIIGSVANLPGVTRIKGYENDTDTTDSNGIPSHSIAVIVEGGDEQVIAETIAEKKTPGTGTFGDIVNTIIDSVGSTHLIRFSRPTDAIIKVNITIEPLPGYSASVLPIIQQAVVDYINELPIGSSVIYSKLFVPANLSNNAAGGTYNITDLTVARDADPPGTANIPIAFDEAALSTIADIVISVV